MKNYKLENPNGEYNEDEMKKFNGVLLIFSLESKWSWEFCKGNWTEYGGGGAAAEIEKEREEIRQLEEKENNQRGRKWNEK